MTLSFLPANAFPLPSSLAPTLVTLGLDDKAARTVSKVYLSAALALKERCETEYVNACHALVAAGDDRGYSSKELRAKLLTASITRYSKALSTWVEEVIQKAKKSVLKKGGKHINQYEAKSVVSLPSRPSNACGDPEPQSREKPSLFSTTSPLHAFPHTYPSSVRPEPIEFVTLVPLLKRRSVREQWTVSDGDIDACADAFSRLSLGPPISNNPSKPSKTKPIARSRTHTTSGPKRTSQLSPSCPRLVSPMLDTTVAVPHSPPLKTTPSSPSLAHIPRTQSIDIPRSSRRKVRSIPYQRPTMHPPSSPASLSPSPCSHSIRRTPSLVSDNGSEASSPSTPPDFPPMPTHTSALSCKGPLEATFQPEYLSTQHEWWHSVDFGNDIYR